MARQTAQKCSPYLSCMWWPAQDRHPPACRRSIYPQLQMPPYRRPYIQNQHSKMKTWVRLALIQNNIVLTDKLTPHWINTDPISDSQYASRYPQPLTQASVLNWHDRASMQLRLFLHFTMKATVSSLLLKRVCATQFAINLALHVTQRKRLHKWLKSIRPLILTRQTQQWR